MDLLSALSLGELALSFSRVPLFPVFDLSYFIVSIIYLKYEPGESGDYRRSQERGLPCLDDAGSMEEEAEVEITGRSHARGGGGGNPGDGGAVERGLQMVWEGRRGALLFTVGKTGAAGLGAGRSPGVRLEPGFVNLKLAEGR